MLLAGLLLMGVLVMGVHSLAGAGTDAGAASSARILLTGLLVMGVFGSCSTDPLEQDTGTGIQAGGTVRMTFDLGQEFEQAITVKAADAVDVNLIKNVWVLQFDESGQEVQPPKFISTINTAGDDYRISVDLKAVQGQVWFIANTHNDQVFNASFTLDRMQTISRKIASESDLAPQGTIPMQGVWKGTPGSSGVPDKVGLKRSVCRVTLNLSAQLPAGDIFQLQSITVKQVPAAFFYAHDDDQIAQYPYPNLDYIDRKMVDFFQTVDIAYDQNASAVQTFSWLLPENARGIGTAAEPTKKTGDTAPAGQSEYATYIELTGNYTPAGKAKAQSKYYIYLGADNIKDYNLLRGHAYTVRTVIRGVNTADNRIEYMDALDYTDNGSAWFGVMPKPANGVELKASIPDILLGASATVCPKYYHLPDRAELMIVSAYYKALPDAGFSGTYVTPDRGPNSNEVYFVNLDPGKRSGRVYHESYSSGINYPFRCVRDLPSTGKLYPYVEWNSDTYIVISRDEEGGVRPEALGAGGQDELVSPKFEVQKFVEYTAVRYSAAESSCPEGWRLPNKQEGLLITALNIKRKISLSYNSSFGDTYWLFPGNWSIIMTSGLSKYIGSMSENTSTALVRCIRDVVD